MAKLRTAVIKWIDDELSNMSVTTCDIETEEEFDILMDLVNSDNADFEDLDSRIWFYFDIWSEPNAHTDYAKQQNGTDFIVLSVSDDFDEIDLKRFVK